jgi:hypothetical protein
MLLISREKLPEKADLARGIFRNANPEKFYPEVQA